MTAFYTDHNVTAHLAPALRSLGHSVVTARDLGLQQAADDEHLLLAAQRGWLLVTHNATDFALLHDAWRRWGAAWRVRPTPEHAGILVMPDLWTPERLADELDRFLQSGPRLVNQLYRFLPGHGWAPRP